MCESKFGDKHQGRIQDIGKGRGPTLEESEMRRHSRRGDAEGVPGVECERGLTSSHWEGLGVFPRKFSKLGCFLLQSRHFSALFPGRLTQDFSDWHRLTHYSDKKKNAAYFAAGAVLTATLRAQCPIELWNRPKLCNTLGWWTLPVL